MKICQVICGPSRVNTVGCRIVPAMRIAKKLTGISVTPKSAYDGGVPLAPRAWVGRVAEHEVRRVEEEQDEEENELPLAPAPPGPHDVLAQIEPVMSVEQSEDRPPWWIAT